VTIAWPGRWLVEMVLVMVDQSARRAPAAADEGTGYEVSVILPCLNEAETVGACVTKAVATLRRLGVRGEVVAVDNGSARGAPQSAQRCGARGAREARA